MKIEEANKEFWMSVFHDIKNPMISIDFALRGVGSVEVDVEILEDVYNLNLGNLEFIRAILENYRFEEGFFEKKHENINLKEFLNELVGGYKYILQEKELRIDLDGVEEDLVLNSCPISISRVFSNLITNAAKFAPDGTEIMVEARPYNDSRGGGVFIAITNYGEKIEDLKSIFKKFTSYTDSSGLGLYICRKIVNDFGGEIWAENFDDGVKFCIVLKG